MKLTRISLDDWEGIYGEDGRLISEGHSLRVSDVLEAIGHEVESRHIENDDLGEFGNSLPETLPEILDYIKRKGNQG